MDKLSFQDYMEMNKCWGCGSTNNNGLQIKSHWSGDESVCTWMPSRDHMAGPTNILNGGIIATIIDCHSVSTAIAAVYKKEGREMDTEPFIWYVTASLKVDFLSPTPVDRPVNLIATIKEMQGKKVIVSCSLFSNDRECAKGEVLSIRVPPENWYKG